MNAIIYFSQHHNNTKKLVEAIAEKNDVDLINVIENKNIDISKYDCIGIASGIYFSKFHKSILEFVKNNDFKGKKIFLLCTYGAKNDSYTKSIRKMVENNNGEIIGEYGCFGFDSYGPFKLIGGIKKQHPNEKELEDAVKFYNSILK